MRIPVHDHEGRTRLAVFLHKAGDGKTAESLVGAVLEDGLANGNAVETAAKTLILVSGAAAVPKVLLAVDRWSEGINRGEVWHAAKMLKHLAVYPEAAVVSRVRALLEHWNASGIGANSLIEAWLASEPAAGESILDAIDRGAALDTHDLGWSAQHLQDAGQQAAATELAERLLRYRHGRREHYEEAASVLLKADRAVAMSRLIDLAQQNPPSAWLAGVMEALEPTDAEVERACLFCARELVIRSRIDGEELQDALIVLLCLEGEVAAKSVTEAVRMRPELSFYQRRKLVRILAAVQQLDLARSAWDHLLEWQSCTVEDDICLVDDLLNAGMEQWTAKRIHELIDNPATAPLRVQYAAPQAACLKNPVKAYWATSRTRGLRTAMLVTETRRYGQVGSTSRWCQGWSRRRGQGWDVPS